MTITAHFTVDEWTVDTLFETGNQKFTRELCRRTITGAADGTSRVEYLMSYGADGVARFIGYELFEGQLGGRSGTFLTRLEGTCGADGVVHERGTIDDQSGTGGLTGISGTARFESGHNDIYVWEREVQLPE